MGGIQPQATDTAVFGTPLTGITNTSYTWTPGSGTSNFWLGIQVLSPGGNISINDLSNSLTLGNGGIDMSQATRNLSINTDLWMGSGQTWSTAAGTSLLIGGTVVMGSSMLALTGAGNTTITAAMTGGSAQLVMAGTGTLTLSGANGYTGATTLQSGVANLDFSGLANTGSGILPAASALTMGKLLSTGTAGGSSATLNIVGNSGFVVNQTFNNTTIAAGLATINAVTGQGATVNLGTISKSAQGRGASLRINGSAGSFVSTFLAGSLTTTAANGAWFTYGLYDFAGISGGSIGVAAYSPQTAGGAIAGSGIIDFQIGGTGTLTGSLVEVRFNQNSAAQNYVVGTANQQFGGALVTPNVGAANVVISGTNAIAPRASGGDIVIWQNDTSGTLTFSNSAISGTLTSQFIKNGLGLVVLANSGTNTLSNWQINEGLLQVDSSVRFGSGKALITLDGGGVQYSANGTLTVSGNLHTLQLGPGGGTLDVMPGVTLLVDVNSAAQIIGTGALTVADAGQLTVAASNNSYSGGTSITTGNLLVTATAGTPLGTGIVNVGSAGKLQVGGILTLASSNLKNTGLVQAAGGTLVLTTVGTALNAGGIIEAAANSVVTLNGNVFGGIVRSQPTGTVTINGGVQNLTFDGNVQSPGVSPTFFWAGNITNTGTVSLLTGGNTYFNYNSSSTGNFFFTNSGLLQIADGASVLTTGTVTLTGAGKISLLGPNAQINGGTGPSSYLITDNLITGQGTVGSGGFKIVNSGTISATTGTLQVQPFFTSDGLTNTGMLQANGGTLVLTGLNVINTGGVIEADANSVAMLGLNVSGGTVRSLAGGTVTVGGGLQNVSLAGNIQSNGVSASSFWGGTVSNSGTVSLLAGTTYFNPNTSSTGNFFFSNSGLLQVANTASILTTGTVTLLGGGAIALQGPSANINGGSGPSSFLITNNFISGQGMVGSGGFKVVNSGTISATTGTLQLQPFGSQDGLTNSGLLSRQWRHAGHQRTECAEHGRHD